MQKQQPIKSLVEIIFTIRQFFEPRYVRKKIDGRVVQNVLQLCKLSANSCDSAKAGSDLTEVIQFNVLASSYTAVPILGTFYKTTVFVIIVLIIVEGLQPTALWFFLRSIDLRTIYES